MRGILYTILVIVVLALLRLSTHPPTTEPRRNGPGRRLVLRRHSVRSVSQHEHVAFDPLVAEFERKSEQRALERQTIDKQHAVNASTSDRDSSFSEIIFAEHAPGQESQPDPWGDNYEAYMNDEEHFNISQRLTVLFPLLDIDPLDHFVSLKELQDWHVQQALKDALYRTNRELQMLDTNQDGLVSFKEYLPSLTSDNTEVANKEHDGASWWKEYFKIADEDEDTFLNKVEFFNFLHSEDGNSTKLHLWSRKQQIKSRDQDNDGKLSFLEFDQNLFDIFINHNVYSTSATAHVGGRPINREKHAKAKFAELDVNNDGFLTEDEFGPVMEKLQPGETFYAKQQAGYLIQEADEDRDGRLSLKEMLEHPYIFYSTVYRHNDETNMFHDEFR
ncbi:hypothetical protein O6H91_13G102000 [Diphasiastrum complanatum]|uniref:Uncharacterized protein n=1 Tax=Diphasiastrum complanatum TaxID=34168 RepID=A0ACC2BXV7_DIPCM|nr:hypothetical protein O6H91_13G102000 [Diphasiastrum complanatum]